MKYMIASDIHGSAYDCRKLMRQFEKENANYLILLGDLLYHGARNDLPEGYAPKGVAAILNERKDRIFCVRGNCDSEVDQMVLEFPIMAEYMLMQETGKLIFVTHGHHYNIESLPALKKGDILLHGHTHIPACQDANGIIYLNPGSISIPKQKSVRSYMTLEEGVFEWKELETRKIYQTYDMNQ